ncbi:MAG: hypothetical protein RLZZ435_3370 [Cyanobacteriota bacterium]
MVSFESDRIMPVQLFQFRQKAAADSFIPLLVWTNFRFFPIIQFY